MKKTRIFFLSFVFFKILFAQESFSFDKKLKKSVSKNGLHYFLHPTPKTKQIVFYLLIKVGSLQETKAQLGHAHFLEHMAFKGGKSFKNKSFTDYLAQKGLQMGQHFNAVTSYQKTIYEFKIPDERNILDTLFLFSKDLLSGDLIFKKKYLEREKKIILEEKRVRPALHEDFKWKLSQRYLDRLPIGTEESIKKTTQSSLEKFYKKWYAPQNATLIITGSFDAKYAREKIEKYFSKKSNHLPPIKTYCLYKNISSKFRHRLNKDLKNPKIVWQQPQKMLIKDTPQHYKKILTEKILQRIVEHRLEFLQKRQDYKISISRRYFLSSTDFYTLEISSEKIVQTLGNIFKIYREMAIYGIEKKYLDRHKEIYLDFIKNDMRITKGAEDWAAAYLDYAITKNMPINTVSKKQWTHQLILQISSKDLQNCAEQFFKASTNLITYKYPSKKQRMKKKVFWDLYTFWAKQKTKPINYTLPGKITLSIKQSDLQIPKIPSQQPIKQKYYPNLKLMQLVYKNGAEVFVKPMKNKEKEIRFVGIAKGGTSFIPDSLYYKYASAAAYMELGGIGNLNNEQLEAFLDDKMIALSVGNTENSRRIYGYTLSRDIENFFKYFYLKMVQARSDKKSFEKIISQEWINAKKQKNIPQKTTAFMYQQTKACIEAMYFPKRQASEDPEKIKKISLAEIQKFYNQCFANPLGWRYVCAGDFTISQIRPLLDKYIGGMAGKKVFPKQKKIFDFKKYPNYQIIYSEKKQNKTKIHQVFYGTFVGENAHLKLKLITHIIRKEITDAMREQYGWVYTPIVYSQIHMEPEPFYTISISYTCSLKNKDILQKITLKILKKIIRGQFSVQQFLQAKKNRTLSKKEIFENNHLYNWAFTLIDLLHYDVKINELDNFETILKEITQQDLQTFLRKTFNIKKNKILEYR